MAGGINGTASKLDKLLDLKLEVAVENADGASSGFRTNTKVGWVLESSR